MIEDIGTHVGRRLRTRRRLLGLTQTQLGAAIGVRFQQIQKYECAANCITINRLWQLADVLGVHMGYFFEGYEQQAKARADLSSSSEVPARARQYSSGSSHG